MNETKRKVLVVEDSLVAQKLLRRMIMNDTRFELIGVVDDGKQACEFVSRFSPDVISMDLLMPVMDGVEATREIMRENPVPVVIVSSFYQTSEIDMAIRVMEAGAVSILPRPFGPGHPKYEQSSKQYLNTLKSMSEIKVVKRKREEPKKSKPYTSITKSVSSEEFSNRNFKVLAIGASAGGPEGLSTILSSLPIDFPVPVFVVQHIDGHFADSFATWLNNLSQMPVSIAVNGEKALAGHVYLPPGNHQMIVNKNGTISTQKEDMTKHLCPSVDVLFKSIAQVYGNNSMAVLLSGMGKDGVAELKNLYDLGAYTMVQDENTSMVYGMPGEAVKIGATCKVLPPASIVLEINQLINKK
jgi:two-component system chemotaxis response regulator CheB